MTEPRTFQPHTPDVPSRPNQPNGPSWNTQYAAESLRRISTHGTWHDTQAQALTEAVVLLHSIRRILIWVMVIVPIVLVGVGVWAAVMIGVTSGSFDADPSYLDY